MSGPVAASLAIHGAVLTVAALAGGGGARRERTVVIEVSAPEIAVVCEEPAVPAPILADAAPRAAMDPADAPPVATQLPDPFDSPPAVAPGTEAAPVLAFATPLLGHRFAASRAAPASPAPRDALSGAADGAPSGEPSTTPFTTPFRTPSGGPDGRPDAVAGSPPAVPRPAAPAAGSAGVSRGARFRETPARPGYPSVARRRGWEGRVLLRLEVGPDGVVSDVSVAQSSGRNALDEAAVEGAFRWSFEPALEDGRPVASTVEKAVEFRLVD